MGTGHQRRGRSVSRGPGAGGWVSSLLVPPALLGYSPRSYSPSLRVGGDAHQGIPFLSALWVLVLKLHLVRLSPLRVCGKTGRGLPWLLIAQSAPWGRGWGGGWPLEIPPPPHWLSTAHPWVPPPRGPAPSWPSRTATGTAEDARSLALLKDLCLRVCINIGIEIYI